jgi:excisionase family DNA binding protein
MGVYEVQMKRLMTIREFGDAYGPKRTTTYDLIAAGKLHAVKCGPRTLIKVESAERWAASLPRFQSSAAASVRAPRAA